MKPNLIKIICGLILLGAVTTPAQSLISTLTSTPLNYYYIGSGQSVAILFTTGSQSENIGSLSLNLVGFASTNFQVAFYTDGGGQPDWAPGSLVNNGLLAGPANPVAGADINNPILNTYTASGLTLAASTTYWLAFTDPTGATGFSYSGTPLITDNNGCFTLVDFYEYFITDYSYAYSNDGPNFAPLFLINGTDPVPEPTTLALAALGGAGLLLFHRRK